MCARRIAGTVPLCAYNSSVAVGARPRFTRGSQLTAALGAEAFGSFRSRVTADVQSRPRLVHCSDTRYRQGLLCLRGCRGLRHCPTSKSTLPWMRGGSQVASAEGATWASAGSPFQGGS